MKKFAAIFLVLILGGAVWFFGFSGNQNGKNENQVPAQYIAKASKRNISFSVEVTGDVAPAFQLDVKPEVGGKIKALHVEPGKKVEKGELLVEIDDRDLLTEKATAQTDIEGARLTLEKNKRNYERAKELFEAKLISEEVYDNLASEHAIAENNLVKAQRRMDTVDDKLSKTKIHAPTSGTILSVGVIEGQVVVAAASVNSGTLLMSIADLSSLIVQTHINQVDVARVKLHQKVRLFSESLNAKMGARISFIAPVASVKNNVKGFQVEATIENPTDLLRPGMTVNLSVPIATAKEAIAVPISAVFTQPDDSLVVFVKKGETTESRPVQVGVTNLNFAEIKSGVSDGEEVLLIRPPSPKKKS